MRPSPGTYPQYYQNYLPLVKEDDIIPALSNNWKLISDAIRSVPPGKENFAYAEGKWTVKQLLLHVCDTERVFAYRALRFARQDAAQPLPFDENQYAAQCEAGERSLDSIAEEFKTVRNATLSLFSSFSVKSLTSTGKTAMGTVSVLAIGFMICGHAQHHINVLRERYLQDVS